MNTHTHVPPTGARRLSAEMIEARQRADTFAGFPAGTAKPMTYLAAFQEALPYLGLPACALLLVTWLIKQTRACDWETGSRPIAWPSARRQQEYLNLSPAPVKALNRLLFEAGIFVIRDNEQGKRYGRRGPDKRIIEAYGFDLSPLAQRYKEFVRIAAEAKIERGRMTALRKRITIGRRSVFQAGEVLVGSGLPLPEGWLLLASETAELVKTARKVERSAELASIAKAIESRQSQAEQWVIQVPKPVEINPVGLENKPHNRNTNLNSDLIDTVMAAEESSPVEPAAPPEPEPQPLQPPQPVRGVPKPAEPAAPIVRKASELIDLVPRLGQYVVSSNPGWDDIVNAAGGMLRHDLGVSATLWSEACTVMGREGAALALAIVSTKPAQHFTRGAGGYFGGMVRKARKGELYLEKSLWGLRQAKYGKPPSKAAH